MINYASIVGTGVYLPRKICTNQDLEHMVQTSHEWIVTRTGIEKRHLADSDELTSVMATEASKAALQAAGLAADAIDLIIVATSTPDKIFPSVGCLLHQQLAIKHPVIAFDVSAACAGFVYALTIANQFIQQNQATCALVVGSEMMSRAINWQDRKSCVLFGDGAGAVVLKRSANPGIRYTKLHADGSYQDLLALPNPYINGLASDNYLTMQGPEVYKVAVKILEACIQEVLTEQAMTLDEIDWLIPHQANIRILHAVAKKMNFPLEKMLSTLEKYGNTSAASIPITLHEGIKAGKINKGDTLLLEGFGGGMAWGSVLLTL